MSFKMDEEEFLYLNENIEISNSQNTKSELYNSVHIFLTSKVQVQRRHRQDYIDKESTQHFVA